MRSINGYEIIDTIYEGKNSIIMRGIAQSNKKPVVIKTLRNEYPNQEELARFRREYEINLKAREVSQIFSLENSNDTLLMTWEDVGADSLEHLLYNSPS
ncbi:MAG: hypothetical protein A2014_03970 [Spirochaetes bacterium GWF1_49_6]|nr:MAG: hypothetical protein A2014_03970 [Spirochaetes bacterium GWF1_49_6]